VDPAIVDRVTAVRVNSEIAIVPPVGPRVVDPMALRAVRDVVADRKVGVDRTAPRIGHGDRIRSGCSTCSMRTTTTRSAKKSS
jgi:hypothetical protein